MGCFLGCFGITTKRRRRRPANRILPGDTLQKLLSYEPLDSSVSINGNTNESITSNSQLSDKPKERSSIKVRKKVSFNLNVQTYEPIPDEETSTYQFLQSVEEKENKKNGAEAAKGSLPSCSYPSNYRYQNCGESYDEEDEMTYEESDVEDDDYYDNDDYDNDEDGNSDDFDKYSNHQIETRTKDELLDRFDSLSMESSQNKITADGDIGCENGRIRSQYLCSVLNPVENTRQWKEIKARAAAPAKHRRKENIAVKEEPQLSFCSKLNSNSPPNHNNQSRPLLQDIAVDASLSNWLIAPNMDGVKPTNGTRSCSIGSDSLSSKISTSDDSFSWRNREDREILDITNL